MTSAIGHMIQYIFFILLPYTWILTLARMVQQQEECVTVGYSYFGSDLLLLIKISDISIKKKKRRMVLKILAGVIAGIDMYIYYALLLKKNCCVFVYLYLVTVRVTVKVSQL